MNGRPFSADEDKRLLAMRAAGCTLGDVGKAINRSPTSCRTRAAFLEREPGATPRSPVLPSPPPPIDWAAVRAEQAAKPAADRWPYPKPALVERVWQSREPTWVAGASSLA